MTNRKDYCTMNMMKKKYIAPAIEVVEVELISMLAVSDGKDVGGSWGKEPDEELSNRRRDYWNSNEWGW